MPNSEDYLDGLLDSINKKKTDVEKAQFEEEESIKAKIADMSSVDPNDDFMEATGISGFKAKKVSHDNLRQAFSESDFLKEFEDELSSGAADDFIRDFEQEIDEEEAMFQRGEEIPDDAGTEFIRSLMEEDGVDYDEEVNDEEDSDTTDSPSLEDFNTGSEAAFDDVEESAEIEESTEEVPVSTESETIDNEASTDDATVPDTEAAPDTEAVSDNESSDADTDVQESEEAGDNVDESAGDSNDAIAAFESIQEDLANASEETEDAASDAEDLEGDTETTSSDEDDAAELLSALGETESTEDKDNIDTDEELKNILDEVESIVGEDSEGSENDESILSKEYQSDEYDEADALEVNEDGVSLVDENIDLDELLESEGGMDDIGDMLNADENDIELDEARDAFEESAGKAEASAEESQGEGEGEKKVGFFAKLFGKFKKKKGEEEGETERLNVAGNNEIEDTTAENQKILEEMDEEEAEAAAKKQAKAEAKAEKKAAKKAAAEEKKAAKAAAKAEKANKEKKPGALATFLKDDKSKKVPVKVIVVFVLLVGTLVALIIIGSNIFSKRTAISEAKTQYSSGDYIGAYNALSGISGLSDTDQEICNKARLLADLQNKKKEYDTFMSKKDYQNAFDALVVGVGRYNENLETAKEYGITAEYDGIESMITGQLKDQFGVSANEAQELYKIKGRTNYTIAINNKLKALGMYNSNGSNN